MKKRRYLLPLLCSLSTLLGCSTPEIFKNPPVRAEPVMRTEESSDASLGYYQLGRYYQGQDRLDLAVDAYKKAIGLSAGFVEAHNALGAVYSRQGRFEEAIAELNAALSTVPDLARVYNNLGYVYYLQNKFSDAIASYEKAISLDPNSSRTFNNLGMAFDKLGDRERSQSSFARAETLISLSSQTRMEKNSVAEINSGVADAKDAQVSIPIAFDSPVVNLPTASSAGIATVNLGADPGTAESHVPNGTIPIYNTAPRSLQNINYSSPKQLSLRIENALQNLRLNPISIQARDDKTLRLNQEKYFNLEIANGNGINGLAGSLKKKLVLEGTHVSRITNIKRYREPKTVIQYRQGYLNEAISLSKRFVNVPLLAEVNRMPGNADLRLVLGRDVTGQASLLHVETEGIAYQGLSGQYHSQSSN